MISRLEKHGHQLLELGYDIIPILAGTKAPTLAGWTKIKATNSSIDEWSKKFSGIGIRGPNTVGVDLDIHDQKLSDYMIDFVKNNIGITPHRIGKAPKALLPYRCEKPFSKLTSIEFQCNEGMKHRLEILADGQQFVTTHIHPETKKPYSWYYENDKVNECLDIPRSELPEITKSLAEQIISEFETKCRERNWIEVTKNKTEKTPNSNDAFVKRICPTEERAVVRSTLLSMPADDRDLWQRMGHALKVEGATGWSHDLYFEWSETSNNHNPIEDQKTWESYKPTRTDYRSILAEAQRRGWVNPASKSIDSIIEELALLSKFEYDKNRINEASRLGVRVSTLDEEVEVARKKLNSFTTESHCTFEEIEPWPDTVNGEELLDEIYHLISRFVICDEEVKTAATLWCTFTWFIDSVKTAPIAYICAPEKRCGKTQLLTLLSMLSNRSLIASNITPAAVFRVIEAMKPTLFIDEADTFINDDASDLRGIINSGHTRQTAYVIRVTGENHEPATFSTWGAKAIAGIGKLPETIMDRSIVLELRRRLKTETVERLRYVDDEAIHTLKRKLSRFSADNRDIVSALRPELPDELNDRAQDNWEPLIAIASVAGKKWSDLVHVAALKISASENEVQSISTELLADIKEVFERQGKDRITTADLITQLCSNDEKTWDTFNRGDSLTPKQLAKMLKEYGISSKNIKLGPRDTKRGFMHSMFKDAFHRYLAPDHLTHDVLPNAENLELEVAEEL